MRKIIFAFLIVVLALPLSALVALAQPTGADTSGTLEASQVNLCTDSVTLLGGSAAPLSARGVAPSAARSPDLTVSSITVTPSAPTTQSTITINVAIRNIGHTSVSSAVVQFSVTKDSVTTVIGDKTITSIRAGGTKSTSINWIPQTAGTYTLTVVVDPDNKITESNEANNAASKQVTVTGAGDTTLPEVSITSPPSSGTVSGSVSIIANATDNVGVASVEYAVDSAGWTAMISYGGDTYKADWDSTKVNNGTHIITVRAKDAAGNTRQASVTVSVNNAIIAQYQLSVEIDYLPGHQPNQTVLDYIQWYYLGNNPSGDQIAVTFTEEPATVPPGVNVTNGISTSEFWAIEAANNGGADAANGNPSNGKYSLPEKWVLYGTSVEGSSSTVGYCYVVTSGHDCLAGNYIFIADGTADSWGGTAMAAGAEAVVLMHEMGHSIGIAKFDSRNREVYDPDTGSVMSYLSYSNASRNNAWYYSLTYWNTRNLEYYKVS